MKTLKLILVFCAILAAIVVVFFIIDAPSSDLPKLKCPYCNARFSDESIMVHIKRKHLKFACDKCDECFASKSGLEAHKKTHGSSPQLYKCDRCTAVFNSKGDLKAHRRVAPQFKCEECTRIKGEKVYWHTMALLEKHMLEAHGNEGTFKCPYCDAGFDDESVMEIHVNTTHLKFACDKCPQRFASEDELTDHMKKHVATPLTYKCDRCTAVFNSPEELRNHKRNAPHFKCEECTRIKGEKIYWHTRELLDQHMREVHPVNSEN